MSRLSLLTRHLSQRMSAATLGTARSKLVSEPNNIFAQNRSLSTASKDTDRRVYRNKHGEEIAFIPCDPPPGYVFVPSGNVFITLNCRKLAQKLYAVYRPKSRKRLATQIGLYVPKDAFEDAESKFKVKRARLDRELSRDLNKQYPKAPPADKDELHRLISSDCPGVTGKSALDRKEIIIYAYVRDRYTLFKSLNHEDTEAIARAHQKVREILTSWRGEDEREKESSKSKRGRGLSKKGSSP
ncbi:hypothetical protein BU26DRAFT_43522 [Trematosphaeria pertusa]|uniref:DUF2293 domain-containing protein n=1 Tax=Trematosphaeria pertusa TaxID=390896 RepID=A0A6A6J446_9PLEO|nr:uncharacterized protein BU26DRAFT_43522 [Trematosphaeria pertusa]KAF2257416.1 hypothetical protein BU26DRAFT_43522 [Trematosphaeria pertusa]